MVKVRALKSPPNNRRKFSGKWDELAYLCDKLAYYLHFRRERYRAKRFAVRLRNLLASVKHTGDAIIGEMALALIYEYDGKWKQGVVHRKQEINLIVRLYCSFTADQPTDVKEFALKGNQKEDVLLRLAYVKETYEAHAETTDVIEISKLIDKIKHSDQS